MVSIIGMMVSLITESRFPMTGQQGHRSRNIHVLMKGMFWAIRLTNRGTQTAFCVKIELDEDFILSIRDLAFTEKLIEEKRKEQTISIGQKYDLIFGGDRYTKTYNKIPITGRVLYRGLNGSIYAENFIIDMDRDMSYFSIDSDIDGIINALEKQTNELQIINENIKYWLRLSLEHNTDK